ncbi:metallophosphoesterase [Massilia sp. NR 4-1]|uniref:metallophosphoesterase family protein n=1 Tax=Massilia sp. NR 4-1 TaxID=1678028 RepID=UPI00067B0F2B|nr:metallophosphoesterase family protein [Massilia sp. NR 4-1]AKU24487.1 metallophosphoesterase [Massilia sp. NR 4-1]
MRIAAISDIHGNLGALDAVLADIARRGVDVTVNLGDILSGPLQPRETADRLMALNLPTIAGNHERQVLEHDPARMGASDLYAHQQLRPEQRAWIAQLPASLRLADDVLLVHGTPASDLVYFMETVTAAGQRAATYDEVSERAGTAQASLILCGHTHVPRAVQLDDGRLIVNPGSVGLQAYEDEHPFPHKAENGTPHARYAIVERKGKGWTVEQYAVAYDWNAASALAARKGRKEWAFALKTGRMPD